METISWIYLERAIKPQQDFNGIDKAIKNCRIKILVFSDSVEVQRNWIFNEIFNQDQNIWCSSIYSLSARS